MNDPLTIERLRELLSYDPETGEFHALLPSGTRKIGELAGSLHVKGYWQLSVDGAEYLAHRLAWFYVTGEWPVGQLDHWDTNRKNNAWRNLRPASQSQNSANSTLRRDNLARMKGTYFHKEAGLWHARIGKNGKHVSLGYFKTKEEAHAAYCEAAARLHGEFARPA